MDVVTEDPVLISGTLRSTLDLFGEYDDADIVRFFSSFELYHPSSTSVNRFDSACANADRFFPSYSLQRSSASAYYVRITQDHWQD